MILEIHILEEIIVYHTAQIQLMQILVHKNTQGKILNRITQPLL